MSWAKVKAEERGEGCPSVLLGARVWDPGTIRGAGPERRLLSPAGNAFKVRSQVSVGVVLADPSCTESLVQQKVLVKRNSVLFLVRPGEELGYEGGC